jgi:hypothetical protein
MNHYVSLSLTNRKYSVHLHALYTRTALRTFTLRRDQLLICGQYFGRIPTRRENSLELQAQMGQYYEINLKDIGYESMNSIKLFQDTVMNFWIRQRYTIP